MAATITDTTHEPIYVYSSGDPINPFSAVTINDPFEPGSTPQGGGNGTLTVLLVDAPGYTGPMGTLSNAAGQTSAQNVDSAIDTFMETTSGGPLIPDNLGPTQELQGLTYTGPNLPTGQTGNVELLLSYTPQGGNIVSDPNPIVIGVGGPPAPPPTITDTTKNPLAVASGATIDPFTAITVNDPLLFVSGYPVGGGTGTLSVTLSPAAGTTGTNLGSLSSPGNALNPGTFSGETFTEPTSGGQTVPTALGPTTSLDNLVYTAPTLAAGQTETVDATVSYTGEGGTVTDPTPVVITVSGPPVPAPPTITDTTKNPLTVASGATIDPFSAIAVNDPLLFVNGYPAGGGDGTLSITLSPAAGTTATNLGTISSPANADDPGSSSGETFTEQTFEGQTVPAELGPSTRLDGLIYTAPTVAAGQTETVDATVSYTGAGGTIVDPTPVVITINGPAVTPPATTTPVTTTPATTTPVTTTPVTTTPVTTTPVTTTPMITAPVITTPVVDNFAVTDVTTGQQSVSAGTPYSGPVSGLSNEYVSVNPDNLNISAATPNVFIHSGAGNDAINVSAAGGNNVLDGSTGSNFLTGGSGLDTFFLDDRTPLSDVFSTIVGFHSGDNATIFGVNPNNFVLNTLNNQGAAGYLGLAFEFSAPGKPNASLVLTGYSASALTSGALTVTYGTTADTPGVPGSQYMNIHAN